MITTHDTQRAQAATAPWANPGVRRLRHRHPDMSDHCDTDGRLVGLARHLPARPNKVIALHHFGGCPNSGVRMDHIAADIRGLV